MNWYKRAQLKETLPYFEELSEQGGYVPDENILLDKLHSMGLDLREEIGRGDSGIAYSLSNGDILKITTNLQEGKVANFLLNNPHPSVVKYKSVWQEGNLYYIIMERIETMVKDNGGLASVFKTIEKIVDDENCYDPDCAFDILTNNSYFSFFPSPTKEVILDYLSHLSTIPLPIFDFLNSDNIGIQNGKIKFFDIT